MELEGVRAGVLVVRDAEGKRHAVRVNAVLGLHETDLGTAIAVSGNRIIIVDGVDFDELAAMVGFRRSG